METGMSDTARFSALHDALRAREETVTRYILEGDFAWLLRNDDLREGVYAYLTRPAKRLRPAILLLACGAVGGDEALAIPAAAGVELSHTWTLVHDDLIDNDAFRRSGPTVHKLFSGRSGGDAVEDAAWAEQYGRNLAILVGDSQHAWSVWFLLETATRAPQLAPVAILLAQHLEAVTINRLLEGEILDVQFTRRKLGDLSRESITEMLDKKTAALYEYAALAGAAIGLGETNWRHPWIAALREFARRCGTAFQLQDDILGVVGDENLLGKPVGSDIREGKRTTVTYYAFQRATDEQRRRLSAVLGRQEATEADIREARQLLVDLGGVAETQLLAREMTQQALALLDVLPESDNKRLMADWACYLTERRF